MLNHWIATPVVVALTFWSSEFVVGQDGPQSPTPAHPLSDFRRVFIPEGASAIEKTAAAEIAHYVGRIVGRELKVVPWREQANPEEGLSFFVGTTLAEKILHENLSPWKEEEWFLRSIPNGLVLAGDDGPGDPWSVITRAGTLLATYTLLDDYLGVRWLWPGEFGEHVPQTPDAKIPSLNKRRSPTFAIRSVQLGYSRYQTPNFRDASRKWTRRSRLGWTRSAVFGHSWESAFELRQGETFQEHPEWFALVNGKRQPPQMCTTHPQVIERMVEHVLKAKSSIANISPSDGGGFCQCNETNKSEAHRKTGRMSCTSLDIPGLLAYDGKNPQLSDRIFTYVNEVARRARERDPTKGVGMFAYTYYNRPPAKIQTLEPNVFLSFVFQSAAHRNPKNLEEWRTSVSGWKKLNAKMVVREGWGNHYYHDLPFLHHRQIAANLSEARRLGFMAAYGEGTKNFASTAPNFWTLTRMMWDPDRDTSDLLSDLYQDAYGPAAQEMAAYFETFQESLDKNWTKLDHLVDTTSIAYANLIGAWRRLLPVEAVEQAEKHLAAAERLATSEEHRNRLKFHRFGQDYTRLMLELLESYRQLAELGVKLDTFSTVVKTRRDAPDERDALLRRTYDLGEKREQMLLAHRDWAGPDEGLYAYTNDSGNRQWHSAVKRELKIEKATALTKDTLIGKP